VEANSTGGQALRRAVAASDDDDDCFFTATMVTRTRLNITFVGTLCIVG
jgi:hypothetical protein